MHPNNEACKSKVWTYNDLRIKEHTFKLPLSLISNDIYIGGRFEFDSFFSHFKCWSSQMFIQSHNTQQRRLCKGSVIPYVRYTETHKTFYSYSACIFNNSCAIRQNQKKAEIRKSIKNWTCLKWKSAKFHVFKPKRSHRRTRVGLLLMGSSIL